MTVRWGPRWGLDWSHPVLLGERMPFGTAVYPGPAQGLRAECLAPPNLPPNGKVVSQGSVSLLRETREGKQTVTFPDSMISKVILLVSRLWNILSVYI